MNKSKIIEDLINLKTVEMREGLKNPVKASIDVEKEKYYIQTNSDFEDICLVESFPLPLIKYVSITKIFGLWNYRSKKSGVDANAFHNEFFHNARMVGDITLIPSFVLNKILLRSHRCNHPNEEKGYNLDIFVGHHVECFFDNHEQCLKICGYKNGEKIYWLDMPIFFAVNYEPSFCYIFDEKTIVEFSRNVNFVCNKINNI